MMRRSAVAFSALVLLSGCAGTRTPKLAKCAGPYRYANPYGTVLPSLPISGAAAAVFPQSATIPSVSALTPAPPAAKASVAPSLPPKISVITLHVPSC